MIRAYLDLTKFGIVIFVLLSGVIGYALGFDLETQFSIKHLIHTVLGLYFLSSGSLALNQTQEWRLDQKMTRTANRPVASGKIKPAAAGILAVFYIFAGIQLLYKSSELAALIGIVSFALYNGLYTSYLKPRWIFAAVPGAIPGALPVTIGYAAVNSNIFSLDSLYVFLIMFLWQMPHFWVLAIRYMEDYRKGGIPTLPVSLGVDKTILQISLYTFAYVGVALLSPWFVRVNILYLLLVIPFVFKVLQEFFRYYKSHGKERWLAFFLWTNFSMIVFILVPVIDKWLHIFGNIN